MFLRPTTILLSVTVLTGVGSATPNVREARGYGRCETGTIQCCTSTHDSSSISILYFFGALGITLPSGVTGLFGLGCSPITGIGIGSGSTCTSQPVCCTGDNFGGSGISIGCSPITINALIGSSLEIC